MKFEILNKPLFVKKLFLVAFFSITLIPLLYYKYYLASQLYTGLLLLIHLYAVGIYLYKVPWRELMENKKIVLLRFISVVLIGYLLSLLRPGVAFGTIVTFLLISFLLHFLILSVLMVKVTSVQKSVVS